MSWMRRRRDTDEHRPAETSVRLSVLPTGTAVVVLDVARSASSPAVSGLVDEAVRDAFVFEGVDVVEVRRRDGEVLERVRRDGVFSG